MKIEKLNAEIIMGYEITVELEGKVEEYAMSFLHIFNNVREHKDLIKVKNYYGSNEVSVYCTENALEDTIKYLKGFGDIKQTGQVLIYQLEEPDYDIEKYNDVIIAPDFD